jgi:diacylglycerol kinase (ATP)
MRIAIIINPISGRGGRRCESASDRVAAARASLARRDLDADVVLTHGSGHATELARSFIARDFDRIVAWGGDGTINEVAGPLIQSRATLAMIAADRACPSRGDTGRPQSRCAGYGAFGRRMT